MPDVRAARPPARSALLLYRLKRILGYLVANAQTMRWATQAPVFRRLASELPASRVVDVGCGGATYAIRHLGWGARNVVGIEYDPELAVLARRQVAAAGVSHRITIARGDFRQLPLDDGCCHMVFSAEVLEHVDEPDRAIAEAFRVLEPGGHLLISVPVPPEPYYNPEHEHAGFSPEDMVRRLEKGGFDIVSQRHCMFVLTRAVALAVHRVGFPLPLNPLCWFEQLTSRWIRWPKPWDLVVLAKKPA